MVEGRTQNLWDHTSHLLWLSAEIARDRKRQPRPYRPSDFHPHARAQRRQSVAMSAERWWEAVVNQGKAGKG